MENKEQIKFKKIFLFDDASEGGKTDIIMKQLDLLQKDFLRNFLEEGNMDSFEAYVYDNIIKDGSLTKTSISDQLIGENDYTKKILRDTLNTAINNKDEANIIILIDYYLVDIPTGDSDKTSLKFIKDILKNKRDKMYEKQIRILFYSAWPNPKMVRDIRKLDNKNLYYTQLDFRYETEIIQYDLEEFFRAVSITEKN